MKSIANPRLVISNKAVLFLCSPMPEPLLTLDFIEDIQTGAIKNSFPIYLATSNRSEKRFYVAHWPTFCSYLSLLRNICQMLSKA